MRSATARKRGGDQVHSELGFRGSAESNRSHAAGITQIIGSEPTAEYAMELTENSCEFRYAWFAPPTYSPTCAAGSRGRVGLPGPERVLSHARFDVARFGLKIGSYSANHQARPASECVPVCPGAAIGIAHRQMSSEIPAVGLAQPVAKRLRSVHPQARRGWLLSLRDRAVFKLLYCNDLLTVLGESNLGVSSITFSNYYCTTSLIRGIVEDTAFERLCATSLVG